MHLYVIYQKNSRATPRRRSAVVLGYHGCATSRVVGRPQLNSLNYVLRHTEAFRGVEYHECSRDGEKLQRRVMSVGGRLGWLAPLEQARTGGSATYLRWRGCLRDGATMVDSSTVASCAVQGQKT